MAEATADAAQGAVVAAHDQMYGPGFSITERTGATSPIERLQAIFRAYQRGRQRTVPWFGEDGRRSIVRHELNQRNQKSVADRLVRSLCDQGLCMGVRGLP
eukprot:4959467-Alexandrium_andersonii.AAC.1